MSRSLYLSPVTLSILNKNQISDLVTFLVSYRDRLLMPDDVVGRILTQRPLTRTPISTLFSHAVESGKVSPLVRMLNVPGALHDVPEVVTYQYVTFDVLQFPAFSEGFRRALDHTKFKDALLLNVTPWIAGSGNVSDLLALQSAIVRDLLVRSYFKASGTWISPQVTRYNAKIYSMSLAALVAGTYNLTYMEQKVVAGIFAYFFLSQCLSERDVEPFFRASANALHMEKSADVDLVVQLMKAIAKPAASWTLSDAVGCIHQIGIERLKTLSTHVLYTKARSWGPDVYTSALALEYPPYFVYLLLMIASGRKTSLAFTLKKLSLDREIRDIGDQLIAAPGFIPLL